MGWKTIYIKTDSKLTLKDNHLNVKDNSDNSFQYLLDDVDGIVIDNYKGYITVQLLIQLIEKNIFVVINNLRHDPIGLILPFFHHYKPLKNFRLQNGLSEANKKTYHKYIIQQKIQNQKLVLQTKKVEEEVIEKMQVFEKQVIIGDVSNREGHAAKQFFKSMYGTSFVRFHDDGINNALNYGYKILASCISRTLIQYGLFPFLGLFHKTEDNYFNLSYDFIEPFRPIIDYIVVKKLDDLDRELTLNHRLEILKVLDYKVIINRKIYKIRNAIEVMIKSFISSLKHHSFEEFQLPVFYVHEDDIYDEEQEEDERE